MISFVHSSPPWAASPPVSLCAGWPRGAARCCRWANSGPSSPCARILRRGAALVEFALIVPLLFALILGIIEFGRMLMVQQVLTNGSREGARRAVLEDATAQEVKELVNNYLTNASVSGATITIDPATLNNLGFGDPVTVTVSLGFEDVSWYDSPWFLEGTTLTAKTVMRAERLQ